MQALDHWHPILLPRQYPGHPIAIRLLGQDIALYQTENGRWAAVDDTCIHRKMRLSRGWVEGDNLICPYHAWRYDPHGTVFSPGNPKLCLKAQSYEVIERHQMLWLRRAGAATRFPIIEKAGFESAGWVHAPARGPLPVVLDNFCEVEHTPTVHDLFGYDDLAAVQVKTRSTPQSVRVINRGPQKVIPRAIAKLFGLHPGDEFIDDWTTHFSPAYCVYDQYWRCPKSGEKRSEMLRIYVFFSPIDAQNTHIFAHATSKSRHHSPLITPFLRPLLRAFMSREVMLDIQRLDDLVVQDGGLKGMKLGRFDKALGLNRQRLKRIYYGAD